jgi:hypothetical protein
MPGTTSAGRDTAEGAGVAPQPAAHISVSGIKWFTDGVPLEFTLLPRGRQPNWSGDNFDDFVAQLPLTFPAPELASMLRESQLCHEPLLLHVSGYPAAAALINAMEVSGGAAVWAEKRVRFEHGDGLFPSRASAPSGSSWYRIRRTSPCSARTYYTRASRCARCWLRASQ